MCITWRPNVEVQGRCAASSRSVPWNDGLGDKGEDVGTLITPAMLEAGAKALNRLTPAQAALQFVLDDEEIVSGIYTAMRQKETAACLEKVRYETE